MTEPDPLHALRRFLMAVPGRGWGGQQSAIEPRLHDEMQAAGGAEQTSPARSKSFNCGSRIVRIRCVARSPVPLEATISRAVAEPVPGLPGIVYVDS